ncbi:MAG: peroxiredoxin-like family protein [Oscillospiraceae bacterium]
MNETLIVGQHMPDFTYDTPFATNRRWSTTVTGAKSTALVFLRYYGCPICQLDMRELQKSYAGFEATGGKLLVVLQSNPEALRAQIQPDTFSFEIVCDPEQTIYRLFGVKRAASTTGLLGIKTMGKLLRSAAKGIRHGAYEGDELQLPAVFIANKQGLITFLHYGKQAGDLPSTMQLMQFLDKATQ